MIERGGGLRLVDKPFLGVAMLNEREREEFQRDEALQPRILGLIHLAHAARAEQLQHAIVRDDLTDDHREARDGQEYSDCVLQGITLDNSSGSRGWTGRVIESYHLSKLHKRGVYALRDLSLTVEKGEFMFLTGPSGTGKSTFLRLLLREELPSEGDLKVLGRDLKTPKSSRTSSPSLSLERFGD